MLKTMLAATALGLVMIFACGDAAANGDLIAKLQKLAQADDAEAIYHLGMSYHTGSGVQRNPAKALEAFRKSASLGDPLSSYKLGCFYDGQGGELVADDLDLALRYKLKAAEAGYALAQQDVAGLYYRRGEFGPALRWLERAASQGWPDALAGYASVHNGAPGFPKDAAKTAAYFRLFLDRSEPSEKQKAWLASFEQKLSGEEREQAVRIYSGYKPAPTLLTLRALSGQRAAQALVARAGD